MKAIKRLLCAIFGHNWNIDDCDIANGENIKDKIYCSRCGVKYYKKQYKY